MNKQINKCQQTLLLAITAAFIVLSASGSVFAQKIFNAKFPKPDFKAMEEYWEVVEYEYDYTGNMPQFSVVAKKKDEKVPCWWVITWRDAKGVKVTYSSFYFDTTDVKKAKIGEPLRASGYAPWEREIPKIKSVEVTEHESPHWAWNRIDTSNMLFASLLDLYAETAQPEH